MKTHLGRASSSLFDEVERPELSETLEELHDLIVREVARQSSDKNLVDRVGDVGRDDSGNVRACHLEFGTEVVLGSPDLKRVVLEDDAVEAHGARGLVAVAELRD